MDSILILNLVLVAVLIGLTAFFVGSEFAVVKVRMSRVDQLIAEGNKTAPIVKKLVTDLDYYLSACQLGITVTALGLGWLGEPTVEKILHPVFDSLGVPSSLSTVVSFAVAFSLVTFLHVVIGELAPKTLAIQFAEKMTLLLARPLYWFGKIMFPAIWTLNGSARILLKAFGVKPAGHEQAHSEEELKIIMTQSYKSGEINETELSFMQNIFSFDERVAKDIMVPRIQMETLDVSMTTEEILQMIDEHQYTRFPVTQDYNKDTIIGYVNVKELLTNIVKDKAYKMEDALLPIVSIHEQTHLQDVMVKMQSERNHMCLIMDEYGGTAGLLTLEDLLEEIVGEIQDEFDEDETPDIEEMGDLKYRINGRMLLEDLEERFGIEFPDGEEVDTLAGWLQHQKYDVEEGDFFHSDELHRWCVDKMDNHQILVVRLDIMKR
ncbi:hemolysin family protein [Jeotgalibacillus sp. R-1-5s-1]|uniref:hemolysin family protein n=1 Tax=Jeotgalibacillus sp. R-1-5s-1 TaxID=2555897 RepID=UPI00106CB530|nr:hemolysin family protein [Jeotgalibacillus sp. R-1-5s-1]TFD99955.1 HlyC/CorC family transporter [Jeotgalibacillus sp. R-1-5s-1]